MATCNDCVFQTKIDKDKVVCEVFLEDNDQETPPDVTDGQVCEEFRKKE